MILYPSIHIKDGMVARLTRDSGYLNQAEILANDPAARAAEFEAQHFSWLHVVDLNGAFEGKPVNISPVEAILSRVKIPIQLSGGIRDMATVDRWFDKGVARVVLTTAAVQKPELLHEACRRYPGRIAVKIDSRGGYVAATGWTKTSSMKALDLALRVEDAGAAALIYADINTDNALSEVNTEAVIDLAFALTMPVIVSGGVHSIHDLQDLNDNASAGIAGIILGGALYNGKIKAEQALALVAQAS